MCEKAFKIQGIIYISNFARGMVFKNLMTVSKMLSLGGIMVKAQSKNLMEVRKCETGHKNAQGEAQSKVK